MRCENDAETREERLTHVTPRAAYVRGPGVLAVPSAQMSQDAMQR